MLPLLVGLRRLPPWCWPRCRSTSPGGAERPPGSSLAVLLTAATWWGFFYALELSTADPDGKAFMT